jgi:hypothetical protein
LFAAYRNNKVNPKTVDKITKNLIGRNTQFSFIQHLDTLGLDAKANTLVNIALELQNQLKDIKAAYLREYTIRRCYSDISEELKRCRTNHYFMSGSFGFKMPVTSLEDEEKNRKRIPNLQKSHSRMMYELREIMQIDLEKLDKQIELEEHLQRYP